MNRVKSSDSLGSIGGETLPVLMGAQSVETVASVDFPGFFLVVFSQSLP